MSSAKSSKPTKKGGFRKATAVAAAFLVASSIAASNSVVESNSLAISAPISFAYGKKKSAPPPTAEFIPLNGAYGDAAMKNAPPAPLATKAAGGEGSGAVVVKGRAHLQRQQQLKQLQEHLQRGGGRKQNEPYGAHYAAVAANESDSVSEVNIEAEAEDKDEAAAGAGAVVDVPIASRDNKDEEIYAAGNGTGDDEEEDGDGASAGATATTAEGNTYSGTDYGDDFGKGAENDGLSTYNARRFAMINGNGGNPRGGVCPANGNTHVVYVTTQVGTNIDTYDTFGRYLGPLINISSVPPTVGLQKLRGMVYGPDGLLYVAASRASFSRIFAISPTGVPLPLRKAAAIAAALATNTNANNNNNKGASAHPSSFSQSFGSSSSASSLSDRINENIQKQQQQGGALLSSGGPGTYDEDEDEYDILLGNVEGGGSDHAHNGGILLPEDVDTMHNNKKNGADFFESNYNDKYRYKSGNGDEVLLSPSSPELTFLTGEQRMAITLPRRYRMNADCSRNYIYTLAKLDSAVNPNMNHPYAFFFHPDDGTMFVTNQNSITVTRYVGPTTTRRQVLDIMATAAGFLHRTPKLTASLKSLLRRLAPIEAGADPMPYSGGVSGYAGMPLPPSFTILQALRLVPNDNRSAAASAAGRILGEDEAAFLSEPMTRLFGNENNNNNDNKKDSSSSSTSSSSAVDDNEHIPSKIPAKAIGVFAAGWSPFYNLLSVRGMAISPRMLYSVTDRMFVHDMEIIQINSGSGAAVGNMLRGDVVAVDKGNNRANYEGSNANRGIVESIFKSFGNFFFGDSTAAGSSYAASSSSSSSSSGGSGYAKGGSSSASSTSRITIRRNIDLTGKTVIGLRVILVADVVGNSIHVLHEHTGELMWSYTNVVRQPIQIHFPKSAERTSTSGDFWFYVTCKNGAVYKLHLRMPSSASAAVAGVVNAASAAAILIQPGSPMKAVSGFFENPTHNTLYIADRKGRAIYTYKTPDSNDEDKRLFFTGKYAGGMIGEPEHILYTSVTSQHNIPFCYEMGHDGSLRYSALCIAFQMWAIAGVIGAVLTFLLWTRVGKAILGACCGAVFFGVGGGSNKRRKAVSEE